MSAPRGWVPAVVAVLAALLLAACDDSAPPSPLPATRDPNQQLTLSPTSYLLRPDQMPGYVRSSSQTLSPDNFGGEGGDPTMPTRLRAQGLTYGVRYVYGPPTGQENSTPFREVVSQALIFSTPSGATQFFADEKVRQDKPPGKGGSVSPLTGVGALNADETAGFVATAPESDLTSPPQTFLVLARRGRVVVELLGGGLTESATRAQFDRLLSDQETLLAQSPDV